MTAQLCCLLLTCYSLLCCVSVFILQSPHATPPTPGGATRAVSEEELAAFVTKKRHDESFVFPCSAVRPTTKSIPLAIWSSVHCTQIALSLFLPFPFLPLLPLLPSLPYTHTLSPHATPPTPGGAIRAVSEEELAAFTATKKKRHNESLELLSSAVRPASKSIPLPGMFEPAPAEGEEAPEIPVIPEEEHALQLAVLQEWNALREQQKLVIS
ncbi:unnamed protein product [Closterium sp. NIES-53]